MMTNMLQQLIDYTKVYITTDMLLGHFSGDSIYVTMTNVL